MKPYIVFLPLFLLLSACIDDLNVEPDFISERSVFEEEALTEAYVASLYQSVRFIDLREQSGLNMGLISSVGAEHINFANWQTPNQAFLRTYSQETGGGPLNYWAYSGIRDMNYLLENIVNSENLDEEFITEKVFETRWLRAYTYFEMVKRYGGVPLILRVQDEDDPREELFPNRNTEQQVYDFIDAEMADLIANMPDDRRGAAGRIDKYAALALRSRSQLYAASIARFGTPGPEGIVGIPAALAQDYYSRSYKASGALMESGQFSLFSELDDPAENFGQLFLSEGLGNPEVIFSEVFEPEIKGHSLDLLGHPDGFGTQWNSNFPVLYDFVELFEWRDGRPPVSRSELTKDNDWDIRDFFGARDPRFVASVFYPQTEWREQEVYFHTNTTYTNAAGETVTENAGIINKDGNLWPASGPKRNIRNTALLLRKRLDPNIPLESVRGGGSGTDYFVFRYAEILLNRAEAAFYLGEADEALELVNQIRERAGMFALDKVDEAAIRRERQVELAFESHRYWDLKRWRMAVETLNGVRMKGLVFEYNLDTDRYVITLNNAETQDRAFGPERYYLPINQDIISDNPMIAQNPGY